jgi:hypothetical protein
MTFIKTLFIYIFYLFHNAVSTLDYVKVDYFRKVPVIMRNDLKSESYQQFRQVQTTGGKTNKSSSHYSDSAINSIP